MKQKKYRVYLEAAQRKELETMTKGGKQSATTIKRAPLSSLYEAFPPEMARALARRLEIHYTPKHGSWLNIAEIELSALTKQCLGRRIPSTELLVNELSAWNTCRNNTATRIDWQFRTSDARVKLKNVSFPKR